MNTLRPARKRAFLLIMVLMLVLILAVLGFGYIASRGEQYRSAGESVAAAQARAIARAGIEDARAKMSLDIQFPPAVGADQFIFTYSEDLLDASNSNVLGHYQVTLDSTMAQVAPYYMLVITSVGVAGPRTSSSVGAATHSYRAYVDVSSNLVPPSPTYFQIVRFDDLGSSVTP